MCDLEEPLDFVTAALLSFFLGALGAGYFYYGYYLLGQSVILDIEWNHNCGRI